MNSLLQQAITGEPVTVTLGSTTYSLAYPIQAVILYKQETALLDRRRVKLDGRAPLTLEERRTLRDRRREILAEADRLRPAKNADWVGEKFLEFDALLDEATTLKIAFDEDSGAGDSLYDMYNWRKISPDGDPERLLLALWVGLHEFKGSTNVPAGPAERVYLPRMSKMQLSEQINLGNGGDLTLAISKALSAHLIAQSEEAQSDEEDIPQLSSEAEGTDPNSLPPAYTAENSPLKFKSNLPLSQSK